MEEQFSELEMKKFVKPTGRTVKGGECPVDYRQTRIELETCRDAVGAREVSAEAYRALFRELADDSISVQDDSGASAGGRTFHQRPRLLTSSLRVCHQRQPVFDLWMPFLAGSAAGFLHRRLGGEPCFLRRISTPPCSMN